MGARPLTLFGDVARWFADPANWQGPHGIPVRVLEHIELSGLAVAVAVAIAMPVALYLGHVGRGGFIAINVANIGRALPSLALLAFGLIIAISVGLGLGFWPTMFALVPLAIPPIVTNTFVAVRQVDRNAIDAARGMGMTTPGLITKVELPLAVPTIMSGVRTSTINVVATATIAPLAGVLTLGDFIISRNVYGDDGVLAGAIVIAVLAALIEATLAGVQWLVTPRGIKLQRASRSA